MVDLVSIVLKLQPTPLVSDNEVFVIVSLIISNPESVKVANFDVYLELVIEELKEVWKGVVGLEVLITSKLPDICVESHVNVDYS